MGHVNHAVYFTYFEQCRLTFWRELTGTPSPHARVIIARAECDYVSPAHFGDELEIGVAGGCPGVAGAAERGLTPLSHSVASHGVRPQLGPAAQGTVDRLTGCRRRSKREIQRMKD